MANGPQRLFNASRSDTESRCYLVFSRCFSRGKRSVSVSLYPWWCLSLESTIDVVLFRHNLPPPTHAQLMRGEFPETPCIEQGVVLSCRFAKWTVQWTSRVRWMAVVSQSSENSSRQENRELPCREQHTLPQLSPKCHQPLLKNSNAMNKTIICTLITCQVTVSRSTANQRPDRAGNISLYKPAQAVQYYTILPGI